MIRPATLACLALVCLAATASAQGLAIGAKGGVNIASQQVTDDGGGPSLDSRIGFVGGAFVTFPIASWLDVQAEGLYSQKGARLTFMGIESTLELDYLEVPVLARVRFGSGHWRYYAAGGPSMGVRLRARARTTFSGSTEDVDVADQVERSDFGIAMGGGVEIGRLVIEGRYTLGLTDIDKDKTDTSHTKNRAIAVTAGVRF